MKWIIGAASAAVLSLSAGTAMADVVKIGLIADFTGAFATWGTQFQQAIEAYQAVNGKTVKGPDGKTHEIQFVYRDSASQGPDKAKQLGEELVLREKVKMLAGFDLSPHAMAVGEIATQAKIPVVIMNAATASIVRGSPYYVRVSMTIPQHVVPLAQWAIKNNIKKVYMITSDYAPGHDAEAYFSKTFKQLGGEIVGSDRSPIKETNYAVYMEKVLQAKPDALYMFQPAGAPSNALVKAYSERGLKAAGIKLLGTGETQQIFMDQFTDDIIGTVTAFHYTETNKNPANIALTNQLKKMFGDKAAPDIASVAAWDGTGLIQRAVAALGPNADGTKYIEWMKNAKLPDSPRGPVEIDPVERDVIQNIYIRRVEKRDGKLVNIDIDTIPMVKDQWKIDNPAKTN
ncbi:MAG TPA: ABC transporter substrate-binding protein [Xanthobacteraceae bacterium]|nr:ABC transporter substrate-binding protein [Xanthobacteraceae bacterium]